MSTRILAILLILISPAAMAYIGPGAGIPILGSLIGVVVTVILVVSAILFWPIRKMLKNKKRKSNPEN